MEGLAEEEVCERERWVDGRDMCIGEESLNRGTGWLRGGEGKG